MIPRISLILHLHRSISHTAILRVSGNSESSWQPLALGLTATSAFEFLFKADFILRFDVKKLLKHHWIWLESISVQSIILWKDEKPHLFFQSQSFVEGRSQHNKPALWCENHIHFISHAAAIVPLPPKVIFSLSSKLRLFDIISN